MVPEWLAARRSADWDSFLEAQTGDDPDKQQHGRMDGIHPFSLMEHKGIVAAGGGILVRE